MNERDQLVTFSKLKDGLISQSAAAKILNFSVRLVRKKFKRFIEFGAKGLIHQRRNKPSPKVWDSEEKEFAWFEGRASKCTLLVFIDDATSSIVHAELAPSESTESLMVATHYYVEQFGRPLIFLC